MARPSSKHPTDLELEILKVLWRDGASPARHIRDAISGFRDLAYTSVLTILNIMTRKRYLTRRKGARVYIYEACIGQEQTSRRMLRDLVNRVFDGSAKVVVLNLLENADMNEAELRELRGIINRRVKEASK